MAIAANVPVILWGAPGVGKTSVIEQIADHHDWHLETVIASISDGDTKVGTPPDGATDRATRSLSSSRGA